VIISPRFFPSRVARVARRASDADVASATRETSRARVARGVASARGVARGARRVAGRAAIAGRVVATVATVATVIIARVSSSGRARRRLPRNATREGRCASRAREKRARTVCP
jgi:hypothetical protein